MAIEIICECGFEFFYEPKYYEDGDIEETECDKCGNTFEITTSVSINYEVESGIQKDKMNKVWEELRSKYPSESSHPLFYLNYFEEADEKLKELEGK